MIRARIFLTATVLVAAAGLAAPATGAAASPGPRVTTHAVTGCGSLTKVYTPAPGQAMSAEALHFPAGNAVLAKAAQRHVRWLPTLNCQRGPAHERPRPAPGPVTNTQNSLNWSGYQLIDPAATEVEGFWNLPFVTGNGRDDRASVWVGLGGGLNSGSGDLVQDGTESHVAANGATEYYFWIEDVPLQAEQRITNILPAPGDPVAAATAWDPSTGTTTFVLCDWPQNVCGSGGEVTDPPGTSVEWIVERPSVSGHAVPLANYGQLEFTNCFYFEPGSQAIPMANGHPEDIYMWGDTGHELSAVGPLDTPSSFLTEWINFA